LARQLLREVLDFLQPTLKLFIEGGKLLVVLGGFLNSGLEVGGLYALFL
jgi:hypothetical protein